MPRLWKFLNTPKFWPLWIAIVALLILRPRLGEYGFWEPQEMDVAARALPLSPEEQAAADKKKEQHEARRAEAAKRGKDIPPLVDAKKNRPPLNNWLITKSIDQSGVSELSARRPFFFLALLTLLGTYLLALRIRNARSGLFSVAILLSSPLFIFQARQLSSEMGAMAGGVFFLWAAIGLCTPGARPPWRWPLDLVGLFIGSGLGYYSSGYLMGVIAPLGAIAIATVVSSFSDTQNSEDKDSSSFGKTSKLYLQIAAALSALLFVAAFYYLITTAFHWIEVEEGFSIFGHSLEAENGYQPLLNGFWRQDGDLSINFNSFFSQIAFGLFPWVVLAPIAVLSAGNGARKNSNPLGTRALFAWAALAWLIASIALRKMGPIQYAAAPALALAIGIWIDELLDARKQSDDQSAPAMQRLAPALVALFALFAAVVLAKDIKSFPQEFISHHLDTAIRKFPEGLKLHKAIMALGMLFGLSLFGGLLLWKSTKMRQEECSVEIEGEGWQGKLRLAYAKLQGLFYWAGRHGITCAFAISLTFGLVLSLIWIPKLSTKLSSKETLSVFHQLREEGNILGIVGKASAGSKFYAKVPYKELSGRPSLIKFLKEPERVFALVRASELCPIHRDASKGDFEYYVVDDSNANKVMLSNRMWNEDAPPPAKLKRAMQDVLDKNPISRFILREKPEGIQHPLDFNFDDKLQLIGADYPREVTRGKDFEMTLYYKVLKPIRRNWQVFVHFDGSSVRFQGDHYPVKKRCGTNYWHPGDYVVDRFTVSDANRGKGLGNYKIWTGLFVGRAGNWENMKVKGDKGDNNNRVPVGSLKLR